MYRVYNGEHLAVSAPAAESFGIRHRIFASAAISLEVLRPTED